MEVRGVRRSWETLAICPPQALLPLPQLAGLGLPVLQQTVDLGQKLLHRPVRRGQTQPLAGLAPGLF